ncbi:hypothetical protein PBR_0827 [Segatella baroniae B14]|uniref:Uncharacterized protein n=1 Tax=Segatella baroniae B14 TaxID=752555 RepID=D8E0K2_9BACT|nr:hypothetical protein PBR_0827 [Segatella baroniae B14]
MVYIESLFHFSIAKISFSFCNSVAKGKIDDNNHISSTLFSKIFGQKKIYI